jgi:MFS family permease
MRAGVLRHGGLRRLWLGELVSMLGDWLTYVAVGVLAVDGDGLLAVLGVLLAHTLPRALLAPWAGRIADRYDRRAVLCVGSAARGVAVLGMAIAAAGEVPGGVAALFVLRMALGGVVDAAAGAAVPRLVPAAQLPRAHSLVGGTWSMVFAVGVAAGGLLTAGLGPVTALCVDGLTFFAAAAIFAGLPCLRPRTEGPAAPKQGDALAWAAKAEGGPTIGGAAAGAWRPALAFLRRQPAVRRAVLAKLPVMIANGGAWMLVHALAGQGAAMGTALVLGAFHLARALGTGLGAVLWARIAVLSGTEAGLRSATLVVLASVLGLSLADGPIGWTLAALVWGVGVGSHWATVATRVQWLTPDPLRGRMTAVDLVSHTVGQCMGGVLGCAGLSALASVDVPFVALAPVLAAAGVAWLWLEWSTREREGDGG